MRPPCGPLRRADAGPGKASWRESGEASDGGTVGCLDIEHGARGRFLSARLALRAGGRGGRACMETPIPAGVRRSGDERRAARRLSMMLGSRASRRRAALHATWEPKTPTGRGARRSRKLVRATRRRVGRGGACGCGCADPVGAWLGPREQTRQRPNRTRRRPGVWRRAGRACASRGPRGRTPAARAGFPAGQLSPARRRRLRRDASGAPTRPPEWRGGASRPKRIVHSGGKALNRRGLRTDPATESPIRVALFRNSSSASRFSASARFRGIRPDGRA